MLLMRSIFVSLPSTVRTSSMTQSCGIAKRMSCTPTIKADTIAIVSGILIVNVEPCPSLEARPIEPPISSMFERTTSMPTPRPETFVTFAAVDKPA